MQQVAPLYVNIIRRCGFVGVTLHLMPDSGLALALQLVPKALKAKAHDNEITGHFNYPGASS